MRVNLLSKILLIVLVNLLVLGGVMYFIFNLQFDFGPGSPLLGAPDGRIEIISRVISDEASGKSRTERDELLKTYSKTYGLEFTLFANSGEQLGGNTAKLPPDIIEGLARPFQPPPGAPPESKFSAPPPGRQVRILRTTAPTKYWAIARVPIYDAGNTEPIKAAVIVSSNSMTGNGLFFDPKPWIVVILIVIGLSIIIWFPFVRRFNRSISELTIATEQIAEENFSVRVRGAGKDELGRLGRSINHVAERLSGFVIGQKRFLGDISHELNSPLARMNFSLAILENRIGESDKKYIDDVREEVEEMAALVSELLSYSKAGIKGASAVMQNVNVHQLVSDVIRREKFSDKNIALDAEKSISVLGDTEMLSRAFSNVLRNAVKYSPNDGEIKVSAREKGNKVEIRIADSGNGVPESDITKLFDPFYRVEKDRARKSGGTGLGLAIVKSCIEMCQGKVEARNLDGKGFEIKFVLNSA